MSNVKVGIAAALAAGGPQQAAQVASQVAAQARAVLGASAAQVAQVMARAAPPAGVGPVPAAPARGPVRMVQDHVLLPGGRLRRDGAHLERLGPVAVMVAAAARAHAARGGDAPFVPPFTDRQVRVADRYAALCERFAVGGLKCASLEGGSGGGGNHGLSEAVMDVSAEIDRLRAAAGRGVLVLDGRAHMDRGVRRSITAVALVHAVCVEGRSLSEMLKAHGWAKKTATLAALRKALAAALDRMSDVAGA